MTSQISLSLPAHARSPAGYTIVFKDEVTEATVMKYMSDIVDAGGRLTQAYDSFLNVRANTPGHHHRSRRYCSASADNP